MLNTQLDNLQSVLDQASFDRFIDRCIRAERGRVIDLKHPWLQLLVQHDVKSKQLKAAVGLLGLATAIDMLELGLDCDNRLHNDTLNFVPNLSC